MGTLTYAHYRRAEYWRDRSALWAWYHRAVSRRQYSNARWFLANLAGRRACVCEELAIRLP